MVDDRLFTGSHDGTIKVWDIFGIKEDVGTAPAEEDDEEDTEIMLDAYPYGEEEDGYYDENMMMASSADLKNKNKDEIMDMV